MKKTIDRLVDNHENLFGTYGEFIDNPNLIDMTRPFGFYLPKFIRNLRLKEWEAFQIISEDYFMIGAVYDTKIVGISQCIIYEKKTGKIYNFSRKTLAPDQHIANGLDLTASYYKSKEHTIAVGNDREHGKYSVYCKHKQFFLKGSGYQEGDLLSFYHPLGDYNGVYSLKMAMPFNGYINFGHGNKKLKNAVLIVDDHKGYYNRHMEYHWATGAISKNDKVTAFNFCQNQVVNPIKHNENVVWHHNKLHHFGPIEFDILEKCWLITDKNKQIHLRFYPVADYEMHNNYGLIQVDYKAPMGYFEGVIKLNDGTIIDVDRWTGMTEWINNVL